MSENEQSQPTGQRDVTKASIRKSIWDFMEDQEDLARFPRPLHGHIPNYMGAEDVCEKLTTFKPFERASVVAINPDKPQQNARFLALQSKKALYVPIPRMFCSDKEGAFSQITPPEDADEKMLQLCATRKGSRFHSTEKTMEKIGKVDLVIIGSVAVSPKGYRIGNGRGYGDMEYALLRSMGAVDETTPIVTLVHDSQITDIPANLMSEHDVPVDYIITNTREIQCDPHPKPSGIIWSLISEKMMKRVPLLNKLQEQDKAAGKDVTIKETTEDDKDSEDERPRYRDSGRRGRRFQRRFFNSRRNQGRNQRRRKRNSEAEMNGDDPNAIDHKDRHHDRDDRDDSRDRDRHDDDRRDDRRGGRGGYRRGGRGGYRRGGGGGYRGGRRRFSERRRQRTDSEGDYDDRDDRDTRDTKDRRPRGEGRRSPRYRRDYQQQLPALYVGNLPGNLRVSEFKSMVRDRGVSPLRFIWQGSAHYSLLLFEEHNTVEKVLTELQGMTINDRELKVEVSRKTRGDDKDGGKSSEGEDRVDAQPEGQQTSL